jgi:hypothetical protein
MFREVRESSTMEGERTKHGLVGMDVVLDESELYDRKAKPFEYTTTNISLNDLSIRQYDPLFAKKGQTDSPPQCLGNCNGVDCKTPMEYISKYYFVGVTDKDYSGNSLDTAMTVYIQGTFTFVTTTEIHANTQLCCVPVASFNKEGIYDLSTWDKTQGKLGFKFIPLSVFKNGFKHYQNKILRGGNITTTKFTTKDDITTIITTLMPKDKTYGKNSIEYAILAHWVYSYVHSINILIIYNNYDINVTKFEAYEKVEKNPTLISHIAYKGMKKYKKIIKGYKNQQVVAKSLTGTTKGRVYAMLLQK